MPARRIRIAALRAAWALASVFAVAACSGVPAPQDAPNCATLEIVAIDWVERTAEALEGQPLEVVTGSAAPPEEVAELQQRGVAIDQRAAELGCNRAQLQRAIVVGIEDMQSDDPVVSLFLEVVRGEPPEDGA